MNLITEAKPGRTCRPLLWVAAVFLVFIGGCSVLPSNDSQNQEAYKDSRAIHALLGEALDAQKQGDQTNADLLFQEMMMHTPKSPDVLNSYAIYLRELWRMEEAEAVYVQALKYTPADPMTNWNIAVLYDMYLGQPDKALKHYQVYQNAVEQPDKRVHGWVVDMQHRVKRQQQEGEKVELATNE